MSLPEDCEEEDFESEDPIGFFTQVLKLTGRMREGLQVRVKSAGDKITKFWISYKKRW